VRHSRRACRVQRHAIGKVQKVEMHQRGPFRLTPLARNFGSRHLAAGAALRHCSCIASKPHGVAAMRYVAAVTAHCGLPGQSACRREFSELNDSRSKKVGQEPEPTNSSNSVGCRLRSSFVTRATLEAGFPGAAPRRWPTTRVAAAVRGPQFPRRRLACVKLCDGEGVPVDGHLTRDAHVFEHKPHVAIGRCRVSAGLVPIFGLGDCGSNRQQPKARRYSSIV
jgi:hypothetical protein